MRFYEFAPQPRPVLKISQQQQARQAAIQANTPPTSFPTNQQQTPAPASVKDRDTGLRKQVEMPKRIRPWWFVTENGKVCVSVRYGSWTIELSKGKPSVEVGSADELVIALETIKQAVEAGELDAQIEIASAGLKSGFKR